MPEPQPTLESPSRGKWLRGSLYAAVFVAGMLACFHPSIFSGFARMQTDAGDTVLNHYFVEHTWHWLSNPHYPASFWSPHFYYPAPYVLTYSENLVGAAPLYWGLRLFCDEQVAWMWWILIVNACNYWAMLVVLRWFGVNPMLAVLGAFVFAFGLPRQDQFTHQHLMPHLFAPFAVWHFWKFIEAVSLQSKPGYDDEASLLALRAPRKHWFWLLFLTAWQLLASIHLGWFLVFALGVLLIVHCAVNRPVRSGLWTFAKENRAFLIVTVLLWLVGLGLFFRSYFIGNATVRRSYGECAYFMPNLYSWFACPPHSVWELDLVPGDDSRYSERHLFAGFGFYILIALGFLALRFGRKDAAFRQRTAFARSCLITCIILLLVSLNYYQGVSPWFLIFHTVPGANSIRVNGRIWFSFVVLGLLGGSIALQYLLQSRLPSTSPRALCKAWLPTVLYGCLLIICMVEQTRWTMDSFKRADFYPRAMHLAKQMNDADAVYVCYDWQAERPRYEHHISCMWAGLWANVPVVNGYSGRLPDNYVRENEEWPVEEVVRFLGPTWRGRLLVIQPGDPTRRRWYQVEPGDDPASRFTLVRADS